MRKLYLFAFTLLFLERPTAQSQIFYNPSQSINIEFTVKEPFKPIDYSKLGSDFNNMLQSEIMRREKLKQYYDQILMETTNSIYSNTVQTIDNSLNQKILILQSRVIAYIELLNRLLKNGTLKPAEYELYLRSSYRVYMNGNRTFLTIAQYNYLKMSESKDDVSRNKFNKIFNETINNIVDFQFVYSGSDFQFSLSNMVYKSNYSSDLFQFVKESCEGGFSTFKEKWEEKQKLISIENEKRLYRINKGKEFRQKTFESRRQYLLSLSKKDQDKFRKEEKKYILSSLEYQKKTNPNFKGIDVKDLYKRWFSVENSNYEFQSLFYNYDNRDPIELFDYLIIFIQIINSHLEKRG